MNTVLCVADNSGPRLVRCIQVLGKNGRCSASVGDTLRVSVLKNRSGSSSEIKKGDKCLALVVGTRQNVLRSDGSSFRIVNGCDKNRGRRRYRPVISNYVVLINDNGQFLGTRIFCPIPREMRAINATVVSVANDVY